MTQLSQSSSSPRPLPKILLVMLALIIGALAFPPGLSLEADARLKKTQVGGAAVPSQSDWTDYGMVIDVAPFGEGWDVLFEGHTPASVVRKDGVYYLYYVGADNYISQKNNIGPSHRSIGVATSTDGIRWNKYPGNPVITFTSTGNPEEGAVSAGVFVDSSGTFYAYYGSNISDSPTSSLVTADTRQAVSQDGLVFQDQGVVLRHTDGGIWGSGDELHPVMAWQQGDVWYSFYIPNGTGQSGKLGVARGSSPTSLTSSGPATSGAGDVGARGPGSIVPIDPTTVAVFLNIWNTTEVRLASLDDVPRMGPILERYTWEDRGSVVFLDSSRRTWFMIYDRWSYMGLRLAPAGEPDSTPPSAPPGLTAQPAGAGSVELSWGAAADPDTGIVEYIIYRDGARIASTMDLDYQDSPDLPELTHLAYEVRAVNLHGVEGPGSVVSTATPPDTLPPTIKTADAVGPDRLRLVFSEPVERSSAETASNYTISGGIAVMGASLDKDSRTVVLTTTNHSSGVTYSLVATGIRDLAGAPNEANTETLYTYSVIPGLVGYWKLGVDRSPADVSGHESHGVVRGSPAWVPDHAGAAISLDGIEDHIEIGRTAALDAAFSGSFSLSLWTKPIGVPPNTTNSNGAYTMMAGPNLLVQYDYQQRLSGQTTTSGGDVNLASGPFAPDQWYHVVMVVDDEAKHVQLYVNGERVAGSPKPYAGSLRPLPRPALGVMDDYYARYRIGVRDPFFDYRSDYLRGMVGEVQAFSRALSDAEVSRLNDEFRPSARAGEQP